MQTIEIDRKNHLEQALGKAGLGIRMDSKLCYCYVNGQTGPEWDVHRVVHECSVMHWLYNFTDYQARCNFASENEARINYFQNHRQFLSYMRKYIFPAIKESIIRENGGLPVTWPWITNEPVEAPPVNELQDDATITPSPDNDIPPDNTPVDDIQAKDNMVME